MDVLEHLGLALDRRLAPAHLQPHQRERAVQQVAAVGGVGPPRRDLDRHARVRDRRLQPGVVARAERGRHRALERVARARRRAHLDAGAAALARVAHLREGRSEPAKVGRLDLRSLGEGEAGRALLPVDVELAAEALQHPPDEAVIAGAALDRFRPDLERAAVAGRQDQVEGRRMEPDIELGIARRERVLARRADLVRVLRLQPRRGIGEQPLTAGRPRDEPTLGCLAFEPDLE